MTGQAIAAVAVSLDGYIAGPDDSPEQPLGAGGERLFTWFEDGDTAGRFYPWMNMSAASAAAFDGFIARIGAVITGRRTYDIARAWEGKGEVPGAPLFVLTHLAPDQVPPADPPNATTHHPRKQTADALGGEHTDAAEQQVEEERGQGASHQAALRASSISGTT